MSYLCHFCHKPSEPGKPALKHPFYRTLTTQQLIAGRLIETIRRDLESEVLVCGSCKHALNGGVAPKDLSKRFRPHPETMPEEPLPPAPLPKRK